MPRKPAAKPRKTPPRHQKIQKVLEKALENALAALSGTEPLAPKEQKELIHLLLQVVAHLEPGGSDSDAPFTPTDTDKALLEAYVQRHLPPAR